MAGSIEITKNAPSSEDGSNYKTQRSSSTTGMVEDLPIESMELEEKSEATYITGIQLYAVLVGVTLVAFLIMLDQTIMTTAIPQISSEFDSIKDIGWYGSAFLLSTAALQPLTGKLYQFYSSKYLFLGGIALFESGSLICGAANSSNMLIAGRAVAGLGSAGLLTGMLTILAAAAPIDKRPLYLGIALGISSLGLVMGPILGGVLTEHASWRWCFFINLPFGAITAPILFFVRIPESRLVSHTKTSVKDQFTRLDLLGFATFTPACLMLLLAVQWGGVTYPWGSATVIGLLCGAAGAIVLFLVVEKFRGDTAMIPLAMLRMRVFSCAGVTTFISGGSNLLIAYYLPIWFQVVKNNSPTMGGVHYLPTIGAQIFATVSAGALVSKLGYYAPFCIAGCALAAVGSGTLSLLTPTSGAGIWAGFQIIAAIGRGITQQQPMTAIQTILPKEKLAIGNAFVMFMQLLGGALFISFGQTLFSSQLKIALPHFAPEVDASAVFAVGATAFRTVVPEASVPGVVLAYNRALTRVFYIGAGTSALSFFTSFGLGWTNLKTQKEEEEAKQPDVSKSVDV